MKDEIPRRRGVQPRLLGLIYVLAILLPLGLAWWGGLEHRRLSMTLAAATGIASAAMILMQMVTSGRFEAISGRIGIDVTMAFHKWAAPVALAFAIAHSLLLVDPPDGAHPHRLWHRLLRVSTEDGLFDARLALGVLALIVLMALFRDRLPLRYEIWRGSHALAAVSLVGLLVWHILGDGRLVGWTAVHWVVFALAVTLPAAWVYLRRLTRPASECWQVAEIRPLADRLWEVTLVNPRGRRLAFRAGQFAWAAFGGGRLPLYDHPFSIASSPGEERLRFVIQEAGDFTMRLGAIAPGARVGLDAPHGSFGLRDTASGPVLLIAGGVGIAPILSILGDLARRRSPRPVRFLYACRSAGAMVPEALYRPACAALGTTPVLLADEGADGRALGQGPLTEAHLAALLDGLDPARVEALICGPGPMMTMAADALVRLGVPEAQIDYERFSYAVEGMSRKDRRMLTGFGGLFLAVVASVLAYGLL